MSLSITLEQALVTPSSYQVTIPANGVDESRKNTGWYMKYTTPKLWFLYYPLTAITTTSEAKTFHYSLNPINMRHD